MVQVWVDGGTASAAEVLAGALRDLCPPGARLAGTRSYGKGVIQVGRSNTVADRHPGGQ